MSMKGNEQTQTHPAVEEARAFAADAEQLGCVKWANVDVTDFIYLVATVAIRTVQPETYADHVDTTEMHDLADAYGVELEWLGGPFTHNARFEAPDYETDEGEN